MQQYMYCKCTVGTFVKLPGNLLQNEIIYMQHLSMILHMKLL